MEYFEIEHREDGEYLLEKEMTTVSEKKLDDSSESDLDVQIEETNNKMSKLMAVKKAFEVKTATLELSVEESEDTEEEDLLEESEEVQE